MRIGGGRHCRDRKDVQRSMSLSLLQESRGRDGQGVPSSVVAASGSPRVIVPALYRSFTVAVAFVPSRCRLCM